MTDLQKTPTENKINQDRKESNNIVSFEQYEGLIPHPTLMEKWEKIVPGSATKIFERFEKQSDHRIDIESRVIKANNFKQYVGPVFAFIIAIITIIGGIYTALKGLPFLGGTLSFTGLAAIVGSFLINTFSNQNSKKDRED